MPTNRQRVTAVLATIAITVGGAWVASQVTSREATAAAGNSAPIVVETVRDGLSVRITDIRNSRGEIIVLVFDDRDAFKAFDADKAVGYREAEAVTGDILIRFRDLTAGPYAVAAFHDENGNHDLDMAGQYPTEGYATSGARDPGDTPTFREAATSTGKTAARMFYLD